MATVWLPARPPSRFSTPVSLLLRLLCLLCLLQVWAQMEEDLGFLQRAAELRSYNMQVGGWWAVDAAGSAQALPAGWCRRRRTIICCAALHE